MNGTGNFLLRLMGFRLASGEESVHSLEELSLLIEDTEEAGLLDEEQAELVQNVFRLSHKRVRDCMVPRDKMAMLELNTPPDKILEAVREGAHTRMPVYEGTPDNIVGIVNTKDLFHVMSLHGLVLLDDALYPAVYLDPDESIDTALRLFKQSRKPMALVRDQSGTILGLITLEDVIEEIVGDLEDEHDRPTPKMRTRPRTTAGGNATGRSARPAPAPATPAATPATTPPATPAAATTPAATTPPPTG
jgi:CBS domain containing-hemolysin-like protein